MTTSSFKSYPKNRISIMTRPDEHISTTTTPKKMEENTSTNKAKISRIIGSSRTISPLEVSSLLYYERTPLDCETLNITRRIGPAWPVVQQPVALQQAAGRPVGITEWQQPAVMQAAPMQALAVGQTIRQSAEGQRRIRVAATIKRRIGPAWPVVQQAACLPPAGELAKWITAPTETYPRQQQILYPRKGEINPLLQAMQYQPARRQPEWPEVVWSPRILEPGQSQMQQETQALQGQSRMMGPQGKCPIGQIGVPQITRITKGPLVRAGDPVIISQKYQEYMKPTINTSSNAIRMATSTNATSRNRRMEEKRWQEVEAAAPTPTLTTGETETDSVESGSSSFSSENESDSESMLNCFYKLF